MALHTRRCVLAVRPRPRERELPARRAAGRLDGYGNLHLDLPRRILGTLAAHPLRGLLGRCDRRRVGPIVKTSQIALPKEACEAVYATTGYEQSVRNLGQSSLASDNVFGDDGGIHQIATMSGSAAQGYTASLTIGV